ncbi:MAG TPA: hypothetical protein VFT74_01755 [Isosphaeraceae bacterium]|nr:hypothetical protein [Isosphaeraceae bacterium]
MVNLSGHWKGYYTQSDQERPIEVEFSQDGGRLSGRMEDACTEFRASLAEMVVEEGLSPGTDERIVDSIRASFPDMPMGPIQSEIRLSKQSSVEGQVRGPSIRFQKTYEGPHFAGYRIGDIRLGVLGQDQKVEYLGRLSQDGREIEGRWHLSDHPHPLWHARCEGGFYLCRAEHLEN